MGAFCEFKAALIDNQKGISSVNDCKKVCSFVQDCDYYFYNKDTKDCTLKKNAIPECRYLVGPATPNLKECNVVASTTWDPSIIDI